MASPPYYTSGKIDSSLEHRYKSNLFDLSDQNQLSVSKLKPLHLNSLDQLREWITPFSMFTPVIKVREKNRHVPKLLENDLYQFNFRESKSLFEPVTYRYSRENSTYKDFKRTKYVKHGTRTSSLHHYQKHDKRDDLKPDNDGKFKEQFENLMKNTNSHYFNLVESQVTKEATITSPPVQESQVLISLIQSNNSRNYSESLEVSASPLRAKTFECETVSEDNTTVSTGGMPSASIEHGSNVKCKNEYLLKKQGHFEAKFKSYGHRLRNDQLMVPLGRDAFGITNVSSNITHKQNLKPIERITPAMRENYDNLRAREKLNRYRDNIQNYSESDPNSTQYENNFDSLDNRKVRTNSASDGYRVNKLGESRHTLKESKPPVSDLKTTNFQALLPSISGKGIGSVSSTR